MNMTKEQLIRDTASLKAFVGETKLSGKKLDQAIQIMLASSCAHLHQHGNVAVIADAIDALPAGARGNAAKEFVLMFAPVNWNDKKKEFIFAATKRIEEFEESEQCEKMLSTKWTDLKPEAPFRPFDLTAMLNQLLKKAQTRKAEGNTEDKISDAELNALQVLADQLETQRKADEAAAKAAAAEAALATETPAE